jgi:hypothetical protein
MAMGYGPPPELSGKLDRQRYPLDPQRQPRSQYSEDAQDWYDFREYWYGRNRRILQRLLTQRFDPKVASEMMPICRDLLGWARKHKAPSTLPSAPWLYEGDAKTVAFAKAQRPVIAAAMAIAELAGQAWLHLVKRKNKLRLEVLFGHQVTFTIDPDDPADLQACTQIDILTVAGRTRYRRLETGAVGIYTVGANWKETQIGTTTIYPLLGLYSGEYDQVAPGMRTIWLDAQRQIEMQLSDIEHHRENMPAQRYVVGMNASDLVELPSGPRVVWPIDSEGGPVTVGQLVAPTDMIGKMLDAIISSLKILAVTEGIPPESIAITSEAQTGAAKAQDLAPAWSLIWGSWLSCSAWLTQICEWLAIAGAGDGLGLISIRIAEPQPPKAGDPRSYEQAQQMRVDRGVDTPEEQRQREAEQRGDDV